MSPYPELERPRYRAASIRGVRTEDGLAGRRESLCESAQWSDRRIWYAREMSWRRGSSCRGSNEKYDQKKLIDTVNRDKSQRS